MHWDVKYLLPTLRYRRNVRGGSIIRQPSTDRAPRHRGQDASTRHSQARGDGVHRLLGHWQIAPPSTHCFYFDVTFFDIMPSHQFKMSGPEF